MRLKKQECNVLWLTERELRQNRALLRSVARDELQLAGKTGLFWKPQSELKVFFHSPEIYPGLYRDLLSLAGRWTLYGSIKFVRTKKKSQANIGVELVRGGGMSSYVGIQSQVKCDKGIPSMSLDPDWGMVKGFMQGESSTDRRVKRAVRHEFGHAIGFIHEHQREDRPFHWNINWMKANVDLLGGSWPSVEANYVQAYSMNGLNYTPFDYDSVMCYDWPQKATLELVKTERKNYLSQLDRQKMGQIYPK